MMFVNRHQGFPKRLATSRSGSNKNALDKSIVSNENLSFVSSTPTKTCLVASFDKSILQIRDWLALEEKMLKQQCVIVGDVENIMSVLAKQMMKVGLVEDVTFVSQNNRDYEKAIKPVSRNLFNTIDQSGCVSKVSDLLALIKCWLDKNLGIELPSSVRVSLRSDSLWLRV
ncbi:hypothetical protein M8J76_004410 [Diaphorina citri]|nr:hypothetical protein M8J76_004410 [Diaphorina citri]